MAIQDFLTTPWFIILVIVLAIWELILKGLAMWKAAKKGHKTWFWGILIINTVGILPLIYLLFFSKKRKH
jgi:fluoride ion exporter CrcB/FEX